MPFTPSAGTAVETGLWLELFVSEDRYIGIIICLNLGSRMLEKLKIVNYARRFWSSRVLRG